MLSGEDMINFLFVEQSLEYCVHPRTPRRLKPGAYDCEVMHAAVGDHSVRIVVI